MSDAAQDPPFANWPTVTPGDRVSAKYSACTRATNTRTSSETLADRLSGPWSKSEMTFLRHLLDWVRSQPAPRRKQSPPTACRTVAADMVRSRGTNIETAMLRQQGVILAGSLRFRGSRLNRRRESAAVGRRVERATDT
jgi:hypothetical protein